MSSKYIDELLKRLYNGKKYEIEPVLLATKIEKKNLTSICFRRRRFECQDPTHLQVRDCNLHLIWSQRTKWSVYERWVTSPGYRKFSPASPKPESKGPWGQAFIDIAMKDDFIRNGYVQASFCAAENDISHGLYSLCWAQTRKIVVEPIRRKTVTPGRGVLRLPVNSSRQPQVCRKRRIKIHDYHKNFTSKKQT